MSRRTTIEAVTAFTLAWFAGLFVATHAFAWRVGAQAALGDPVWLFHAPPLFRSIPFYEPWLVLRWWWWWGIDTYGMRLAVIAGSISAAGVLALWVVGMLKVNRPYKHERDFGKREWGTKDDAKKAGLLPKDLGGTILGKIDDTLLGYHGDEHQLVAGAAGSGKSKGPVVSSLLSWKHSVLVYDPKRELYDQTAAHRSTIGRTLFFDPTSDDSAAFNPLLEIRTGTDHEIGDIQNLVSILVDPTGSKNTFEYWGSEAARLLTALVLYVLHDLQQEKWTLAEIGKLITAISVKDSTKEGTTLALMLESTCQMVREIASYFAGLPERQLAGVHGSAAACLILYDDAIVAEKTSRSDFTISDLVCSDKPMSIYMQVRPTDAVRLRPLTRLILTQVAQALMYDIRMASDGRTKKHRLLYLLEEFPTLGRLDFFSTQMRVMRGYGMTALLVVQSFKDIINTYGRDQTIVDNCRIVVAFAASDPDTLRMISTMVGTGVETKQSETKPRAGFKWFDGSRSVSHIRRPLLDPGDVRMLGYDEQVVLVTGEKPLRTKKVEWFRHRMLKNLGTNTYKNERGPGQDDETRIQIESARAVSETENLSEKQQTEVAHSDQSPLHERMSDLIEQLEWSQTRTAKTLFPETETRTGRFWITGTRKAPEWAVSKMEEFLADHEAMTDPAS